MVHLENGLSFFMQSSSFSPSCGSTERTQWYWKIRHALSDGNSLFSAGDPAASSPQPAEKFLDRPVGGRYSQENVLLCKEIRLFKFKFVRGQTESSICIPSPPLY